MEKELCRQYDYAIIDFAEHRVDAEKHALIKYGPHKMTLKDIYKCLGERCHLDDILVNELVELEIEIEKSCVVPVWENINLLKKLVSSNNKVVLISDMYLTSDVLKSILVSIDKVFRDVTIYVSCECGSTKRNGSLYQYVGEKENVSYDEWTHYGDNIISDYNVAQLYGINSILLKKRELTDIEKTILKEFNPEYSLDVQLYLGLTNNLKIKEQNDAYIIGFVVGAPILVSYVEWLLYESRINEIETLLFMSRDGYIIKQIADAIIEKQKIDLKTEYIYVSKNVLRDKGYIGKMASEYVLQFADEKKWALVDFNGTGKSVCSLADNLGTKVEAFYFMLSGNASKSNVVLRWYTYVDTKSSMLEVFCRAPHGGVVSYRYDSGKLVPVINEIDDGIWERAGLYDYLKGVLDFLESYLKYKKDLHDIELSRISKYIVKYCEFMPDLKISKFIGDFPHGNENDTEKELFAPHLSRDDLYNIIVKRENEPLDKYYKGTDIEYSMKRLTEEEKILVKKFNDDYAAKPPIRKLTNAKKVVIYAAGKYGRETYHRLLRSEKEVIVAWVDINYQKYEDELIMSPVLLKTVNYDYVLVAIHNENSYEEIRDMLVGANIPIEKIIWVREYWDGFEM